MAFVHFRDVNTPAVANVKLHMRDHCMWCWGENKAISPGQRLQAGGSALWPCEQNQTAASGFATRIVEYCSCSLNGALVGLGCF